MSIIKIVFNYSMIKSFFIFGFALIFSLNCKANIAGFWTLELNSSKGYCENSIKEKEMWTGVNKFAKSIKYTFPSIPPAQMVYIDTEKNSGNSNRRNRLESYPFYIINQTLVMADNMDQLSDLYLSNQNRLTFTKKVEITARTLLNVTSPPFELGYANTLSKRLAENNYVIAEIDLDFVYLSLLSFRETLHNYPFCVLGVRPD